MVSTQNYETILWNLMWIYPWNCIQGKQPSDDDNDNNIDDNGHNMPEKSWLHRSIMTKQNQSETDHAQVEFKLAYGQGARPMLTTSWPLIEYQLG